MISAVNSRGDTDSIAAILGSIRGAYHGYKKLPKRWLEDLEDKDRIIPVAEKLYDLSKKEGGR
ncbi:MAG TPA: ADP-ribosylglycohydrolase family protein [Nitrospinota bacterium]|nr:ADP-ribosylglycohydrolase family protein [Nitrospinota bacterium]